MLLEWSVPAECPSKQDVVEQVTALAGEAAAALPLRVWARVVRVKEEGKEGEEPRWRLELRVGSERAEPRVLESDACRKLAEATAFIVALDLHARAEQARREQEKANAPPPAVPSRPPPPPLAPPPRAPAPPSPPAGGRSDDVPHGGVGSDLVGDVGSLPALAWAGSVFGYVAHGPFRGELSAALWPRNRATAPSLRGAGASIYLRTVGVRGCWTPTSVVPWIDGCLRVEAGVLHAAGYGIARPATAGGTWVSVLAGLTARPDMPGPVRPRLTVELGAPLRYAPVTIEGLGEVYAPAPLVFRVAVGLESKLF